MTEFTASTHGDAIANRRDKADLHEADLNDGALVEGFERIAISDETWNHRAHLRGAYIYVHRSPFPEALSRMRTGLQRFIAAKGNAETATRGFHETMTQFWMRIVAALAARDRQEVLKKKPLSKEDSSGAQLDPLEHDDKENALWASARFVDRYPFLLDKNLWKLFYSRKQMVSMKAKAEFVPSDVTPLPEIPDAMTTR